MSSTATFVNFFEKGAAAKITGKRRCVSCSGYTDQDDSWVVTLLHKEWTPVPASDKSKALCRGCAEDVLGRYAT